MRLSNYLLTAISVIAICAGQVPDSAAGSNVSFQIVTDKSVYDPHSKMLVKFLIANPGPDSLYVHRSMTPCGSLYGQYDLQILDSKGRNVEKWKCQAEEVWPGMQTVDPVSELQGPHWIELRPGNIFGYQEEFDVPSIRGVYRLNAELVPPKNFSAHQKEILQQKQMRILTSRQKAPIVSITVK